jgi:long-chain-fatty-acid--CoA ligase ACSBG
MGSCIAAGIYATNTSEACHYITKHSQAGVVVLEDNKQLAKYASMPRGTLPHLKAIVVWNEEEIDSSISVKCPVKVYLWSDFLELGKSIPEAEIDHRLAQILPGHCSTLIYTSGTTGPPKAVMISHDNITWTAKNIVENYIGS